MNEQDERIIRKYISFGERIKALKKEQQDLDAQVKHILLRNDCAHLLTINKEYLKRF